MGAAWTWGTGIVLLYVIYWAGGMMPADFTSNDVTGESANMFIHFLLLFTFVAVFAYDALYKSPLASNVRAKAVFTKLKKYSKPIHIIPATTCNHLKIG